MERSTEIASVLWLGTGIMLFLASLLISLPVYYKSYLSRMRREEAETLLRVSLQSANSERARIAADLHDSVSGDLVAIRNYLSILQRAPQQQIDASTLEELREGVENALQNTRQVSYKLMPPLLETMGLAAAIADYFERLASKTSVRFTIDAEKSVDLPNEIGYEVFRIVQELTTNLLKYGDATHCDVSLDESPTTVSLKITDDGVPFNFQEQLEKSTSAGLKNISSRLKVVGATLTQRPSRQGNDFLISLKRKK